MPSARTDHEKVISESHATFLSIQTFEKYRYLQIKAIWLEKVVKGLDCTAWKLTTIDKNRLTVLASFEEK